MNRDKIRIAKDKLMTASMTLGGVSVIATIILIFVYLASVIVPIFYDAKITKHKVISLQLKDNVYFATEEYGEILTVIQKDGLVKFHDTDTARLIKTQQIPLLKNEQITSIENISKEQGTVLIRLSTGRLLIAKQTFKLQYNLNDSRDIISEIIYPYSKEGFDVAATKGSLSTVAENEESLTLAYAKSEKEIIIQSFLKEESLIGDGISLEKDSESTILVDEMPTKLMMDMEQQLFYVVFKSGIINTYDIRYKKTPNLLTETKVADGIKNIGFLDGFISLIIVDNSNKISQWFPVIDSNNRPILTYIRGFESQQDIKMLLIESRRKGFYALSDKTLTIYHATAYKLVIKEQIPEFKHVALSTRNKVLLLSDGEKLIKYGVENEHPDVSFSNIWHEVWYESYPEPDVVWQSSSSSNDFEPKFSLVPLTFGTIKAAFYAMLFAVPLAICGALYTAYFMSTAQRRIIKPSIEIMEALPTVILGFFAGLWLAPYIEDKLAGVILVLLIMPFSFLFFAWLSHRFIEKSIKERMEGWESLLLLPIVGLSVMVSIHLGDWIEASFFDDYIQTLITDKLGLNYDQRNSLVVGLAMGFAVIPTIFSIAEDAIYSVPKHLTTGSLALGATRWQTMIFVVLLTASPGIFSAVMIGLGRAVGETMIVLMATGNTAVMDFNIFEGMRTLSANIAVELPESEVGSSHFRVLFLAAMVLFLLTFLLNTAAEMVRSRLRKKYSRL